MKVRDVMECNFVLFHADHTIKMAQALLLSKQSHYGIVVDDDGRYQGIVSLLSLLHSSVPHQSVRSVMLFSHPLYESDGVEQIRANHLNAEIIPVVNQQKMVVGVINIRSLLQYLPGLLHADPSSNSVKRTHQHHAKYTINDIIGQSQAILLLKEQIIAASKTKSTVLVLGETGTGKEIAAHAIHRLSSRRHQPFIRLNCAAIPHELLESELFGYEAGTFTGANKNGRMGKFEAANGGTIFLDEIGDMPLSLQAKILRVLQEKEIEKIGRHSTIPIDIRIIAATHQNLQALVKAQTFRQDLYYRLHVIPIQMPPLREHIDDVPFLVSYFLDGFAKEFELPKPAVDRDFIATLLTYDWPGNIRELVNVLEFAFNMCSDKKITKDLLPSTMLKKNLILSSATQLREYSDDAEKQAILKVLTLFKGNKVKVCDALGISRSSLYNKLKKYQIDCDKQDYSKENGD